MKLKMNYRGYEIKIWDGRGGFGIKGKSYLAQTTNPSTITVRRNSISELIIAIKHEINKSLEEKVI
jgi:hypothetical protein